MESEVVKYAITQGIFAVLFVVLLFYVLKNQTKRDEKSERRENELLSSLKSAHTTNQQLALSVQKLADAVDDISKIEKRRG